ncbi:transglutaminase family protein [Patescibacteria group bacterium]
MLKKISIIAAFIILFFVSYKNTIAQNEFVIDSVINYQVEESGITTITHDITLENIYSNLYATSYTLSLFNINAINVRAYDSNGSLEYEQNNEEGKVNIKVNFKDSVVGKGKSRRFYINYQEDGFATQTGEVWEISIPRLSDENSYRNYSVSLKVPLNFGLEAYISPKPYSSDENEQARIYNFAKKDVSQTGITAAFGQFQVFSFTLLYHLENPLAKKAEVKIAIPPDTAFQKVYYQKLDPKPKNVNVDKDGNWMATYELSPRQRVDVTAQGDTQIFSSYRSFPIPTIENLNDNLSSSDYWQADDSRIKDLAIQLKTPKAIYDYVRENLTYNIDRVQPNVERLGAIGALNSPQDAICMEFTDLFIAIARASGIPAREVNGYAFTENPDIQPLSLVSDVLHSWPEYWDRAKNVWIPIDPTWAQTTGGIDYFNKLDLRHFVFVIHGLDTQKPYPPGSYKLGVNPQKDVFVSFGTLPENRTSSLKITAEPARNIPFLDSSLAIQIENPGPEALYDLYPSYYFDNILHSKDYIEVLPPYSSYETSIKIAFSFLGKNTPDKIKVVADGQEVEIPTHKLHVVITSVLALFILFAFIIIFVLVKTKKIYIRDIILKINNVFRKKQTKNTP